MQRILCVISFLVLITGLIFAQNESQQFGVDWRTISPSDVQSVLDDGFNISQQNENQSTPLMYAAAYSGDPEIVRLLLVNGANISVRDLGEWTPLMYAAAYTDYPEIVELLLDNGADIASGTNKDFTPLMAAAA